jgi:hypothetical protein
MSDSILEMPNSNDVFMLSILEIIKCMDIDTLFKQEKDMSEYISRYEAIGIIDGLAYYEKLNRLRIMYSRLCAIVHLITVFKETQGLINKGCNNISPLEVN